MINEFVTLVKDNEFDSSSLIESPIDGSSNDFISSRLNETHTNVLLEDDDFLNSFICHIIFYGIFCFSLVLHILIDLGLGLFVKNKFIQILGFGKKPEFLRRPVFA